MPTPLRGACASLILLGALALPAAATAALPETLAVDTHSTSGGQYVGPVTGQTPLAPGRTYVAEIQGTMSLWPITSWAAPATFKQCGAPEAAAMLASAGVTGGPVGIDPEQRFAILRPPGATTCPVLPAKVPNLQLSAGGAAGPFGHPAPLPTSSPAAHRYAYPLVGTGAPAAFRFFDPDAYDNYGVFRVVVRDPYAEECAGTGAAALGFPTQGECAAVNVTPAPPPAPLPGATPVPVVPVPAVPGVTPPVPPLATQPALENTLSQNADSVGRAVCSSRRNFTIRIRERKARPIRSAQVFVAGRRVGVSRGTAGRLTARVNRVKRPKGAFTVRISVVYRSGKAGAYIRRYKTCAGKGGPSNGLGKKGAL